MSEEAFRIASTVGICLTFIVSLAAVVVSIIGIVKTSKQAKAATYIGAITVNRLEQGVKLREATVNYATQVARFCRVSDDDYDEAYKELTKAHYTIIVALGNPDTELHDSMSHIKALALAIADAKFVLTNNKYQKEFALIAAAQAAQQWKNSMEALKTVYNEEKVFSQIVTILRQKWGVSRDEAAGKINDTLSEYEYMPTE